MTTSVSQAQQDLAAAQKQLAEAQAAADEERHLQLVEELRSTRAQLRQAESRYRELRAFILGAREARGNAQSRVKRALEALGDAERERPEAYDFLPDDPDCQRWAENYRKLEAKLAEAIAQRDRLPDPEGEAWREACTYEGDHGVIASLRFSEANLLRALEGKSGVVRLEGGVYQVR